MSNSKALRIAVVGPAGFGGSYLSVELLNRGHTVVGISRSPQKLGSHQRYITRPVNLDEVNHIELAERFNDVDVVVSMYGPHTAGAGALVYMPFIETARKLILAYKASSASYFVFVGGAGSLHVPGTDICCVDYPSFFLPYRRAISMSLAHIQYMEDRLGFMGDALRRYRQARINTAEGKNTAEDDQIIDEYESSVNAKDHANDFIKAGRATYTFFDGNESFRWTFVSPAALYRPGKRTGRYEISIDELRLVGEQKDGENIFEGRLTGISVGDMAIAIADEIEQQKLMWKHWSATGDISEDLPGPSYVTLDSLEEKS